MEAEKIHSAVETLYKAALMGSTPDDVQQVSLLDADVLQVTIRIPQLLRRILHLHASAFLDVNLYSLSVDPDYIGELDSVYITTKATLNVDNGEDIIHMHARFSLATAQKITTMANRAESFAKKLVLKNKTRTHRN